MLLSRYIYRQLSATAVKPALCECQVWCTYNKALNLNLELNYLCVWKLQRSFLYSVFVEEQLNHPSLRNAPATPIWGILQNSTDTLFRNTCHITLHNTQVTPLSAIPLLLLYFIKHSCYPTLHHTPVTPLLTLFSYPTLQYI